jgi:hypothetical protein
MVLSVSQALTAVRALDRSQLKLAELGGDGQDQPFEAAFSNLAHAYLRDKAPSLLDHELGFQLLDRNQDNTKSIGVFGFKVGTQMLFAPVFFLQGDLKGHELLYIKEQDLFVPMSEGWLNYILNRKPNILGSSVTRNTAQMGVMQPDLNRISQSPWKYAADASPWLLDTLPKFAATACTDVTAELAAHREELNLPKFCKESASLDQLQWLVETCKRFPKIAHAIISHHGSIDFISAAVRNAAARIKSAGSVLDPPTRARRRVAPLIGGSVLDVPPPEHPLKTGALRVVTYEATQQTELPSGLDEDDAERLLQDGVLIEDDRSGDQVSTPYNVQVEQKLFNPQESGIYEVLVKPGTFERCYIAHQPHGPDGRVLFSTVVRLDEGTRNWLNCHPSRIWCCSRVEGEEYDDWYDGLSEPDSLPVSEKYKGGRMMLIGTRNNATLPFRCNATLGDTYGDPSYEVDFSDHCDYQYSDSVMYPTGRDHYDKDYGALDKGYDSWRDGQRIHLDGKEGTDLRSNRGDVFIPRGYKLLKVEPSKQDEDMRDADENAPVACGGCAEGSSDPPPIRPGNLLDAELGVMTQLSRRVHARTKDASTVQIDDQSMSFNEALIHLVADHGLREAPAREIIKRAGDLRGGDYTFYIKHAQPFQGDPYLTNGGPTAPTDPGPVMGGGNMMGHPGPTMTNTEYSLPVPGMIPPDNRAQYDIRPGAVGEPMDFDTIQKAVDSGQQEVFDTAMIGSMLKTVRDDTMVDKYIPDLIKGMDRLGRILFQFYWHGDTFADRFGKSDMPELEDSLRNAFEMVGDTVLFLKQKTIEPYPEEDSVDMSLDEPASV